MLANKYIYIYIYIYIYKEVMMSLKKMEFQ
jgi:hypothetical protein